VEVASVVNNSAMNHVHQVGFGDRTAICWGVTSSTPLEVHLHFGGERTAIIRVEE
jgi:hypothetical protein